MNKNYQGTVFFDLDGTLLNEHSKVDPDVANAIHQLRENNYLPVICTGRAPDEIVEISEATGIDTNITLNGALVQSEQEIIYENILEPELIEQVIDTANEFDDVIGMHSYTSTSINRKTDVVEDFYQMVHLPLPKVDADFYKKVKVPMIVVVSPEKEDRYQVQYPELKFYKTGTYSIDVVKKGITKMSGIKNLINNMQLDDKPVYAFGDGPNDLEMIKSADYSIAMENGTEEIKNSASYVTSANTAGGIRNGLKHYNLI
ncbi:Cof-type HAD-IIB family hydrolase [Companilactobacillus baiquanensis]|uniref:Cof-type HAD-IIB family hydrolase n=1 Tax=Companilactobacillus baiquanensis TaxID=2486005 RepID=A0ABW1UX85_9LACO|nr:Cof-type HAD-IIB family hydrolase [Companilactobacillus baiquanensis]